MAYRERGRRRSANRSERQAIDSPRVLMPVPKDGHGSHHRWELLMKVHGGEAARPRARRCSTLPALGSLAAVVAVLHAGPAPPPPPPPRGIPVASGGPTPRPPGP